MNLDATFAALADPTRRAIVARLARGEATVGELAAPFQLSLPAVSRHLKVLAQASLIVNERRGKHRHCRLDAPALDRAADWITQQRRFWNASFDRLEAQLARNKGKKR